MLRAPNRGAVRLLSGPAPIRPAPTHAWQRNRRHDLGPCASTAIGDAWLGLRGTSPTSGTGTKGNSASHHQHHKPQERNETQARQRTPHLCDAALPPRAETLPIMTRPLVPLGLRAIPDKPKPKPKPEPKAPASAAQAQAAQAPNTEPLAGRPATAEPTSSGQLPCDVKPFRPLLLAGTCPEAPIGGPHPEPKASKQASLQRWPRPLPRRWSRQGPVCRGPR